jgi:hypothetical protein
MRITNKALLEHKQDRYELYHFDKEGRRSMAHGNLTIIDVIKEIKKFTQQGVDVLLFDYNRKRSIEVITTLEKSLKRRATKAEIIDFYKTISE